MVQFCIRNFICEHTQQTAGPLDETVNGKKNKIPIFHIHGTTDDGQKACLHIHGVLPYLVLRVGGKLTPGVYHAMRHKLNRGIQKEIDLATGTTTSYQKDYIYRMEGFKSRPIYGYQNEEEEFVRVYFSSPWYLQKATQCLGREVLQKSVFQPFEAHLPFHLQFFVDNSIFGMDNVYVKNVKFRISAQSSDDQLVYKDLTVGDVKRNFGELLSPLEKVTRSVVECDAIVGDIMNREMQQGNAFSSNPGLDYIWRDEKERCDKLGVDLVDVFNSYDPRPSHIFPQEREMLQTARQLARQLRVARNLPSPLDALMDSQVTLSDSQQQHNQTIWESPEEELGNSQEPGNAQDFEEEPAENAENEQQDELEMTMMVGSQEIGGESKKKSQIDEEKVKLEWVSVPSGLRQKFRTREEGICDMVHRGDIEKKKSKERVVIEQEEEEEEFGNETMIGAEMEGREELTCSRFLTQQTSMEEPSTDSEESDIVGLCAISLELLVDTKFEMPNPMTDPIVCASLAVYSDVCRQSGPNSHFIFTTIEELKNVEFCHFVSSEYEIFEKIWEFSMRFDGDLMIGYDTTRLSWGYFWRRAKLVGFNEPMNRIMKLDPNHDDNEGFRRRAEDGEEFESPRGRILVAVWKVIRSDLALRSYDLGTACAQVLRRKIAMLDNAILMKRIETRNRQICRDVALHLLKLARINISLLRELNWFFKNAEMARVYGIQLHEVWTRGSQLRVESMLTRLARKMNFVAPSITPIQRNIMSSPEQLQLILEPQSKVYFDPVIVLDFQSLYPSMVIAYNYCYSTILGKLANLRQMNEPENYEEIVLGAMKYRANKDDLVQLVAHKQVHSSPLASIFVKKSTREGVLPLLLREILSCRIMVKNAMKRTASKKRRRILDARQLALKLVANVTYGYTAANWSGRMPCAEIADAILGKGRETLERAIDLVRNGAYCGAEVIYGDTDSMFVLVPGATLAQAFEVGRRIAEDVTNSNPDPVVLKLEKVYTGCVLETKKRYAGWMFESEHDQGKLDAKGIETVRRDTCPIVSEVLSKSLQLIFARKWRHFGAYLNRTIRLMNSGEMRIGKFVFCKEYRGGYSVKAMVPQKKIAEKRVQKCRFNAVLSGERVPYVIVNGPPGSTVYSCVRSVEEFATNPRLTINVQYYLNSHVLAALRRVTDLIPTEIGVVPLPAKQCFNTECSRIGQTPWCIQCQKDGHQLIGAILQSTRQQRARAEILRMCQSCQSCSQVATSSQPIYDCRNFSCLLKQTWSMMDRAGIDKIVQNHKLYW